MKIIFLGTGSAFTLGDNNYQSNMVIVSDNNRKFLFDCGTDIRHSLHEQGLSYADIHAVYISHLHSDHVGGLEWFGFSKKFLENHIANLYISADQIDILWNNVLSGGMSTIAGQQSNLGTFFVVNKLQESVNFIWEDMEFQLIKVLHILNNSHYLPSYGLFITYKKHKIFITSDTIFDFFRLQEYYHKADIIFHDCETMSIGSGVHARFDQLKDLSSEIKHKIWLYDYNIGVLPNPHEHGFLGFVKKGQVFQF